MDTNKHKISVLEAALRVRTSELDSTERKLASANDQIAHLLNLFNSPFVQYGFHRCSFRINGDKAQCRYIAQTLAGLMTPPI